MTDESEQPVEPPSRRSVLKKTAVLGAVSTGGTALVGSAAAQPNEKVSQTFDPPVEPVLQSIEYDVKDVGQDSPDLAGDPTLKIQEVEGREDSGRGKFQLAVQATNAQGDTETSDFRTVPFEVGDASSSSSGISSMQTCEILFLDLKGLTIRLLGLRIRLSRVVLRIDAQQGSGNLLGNLLCEIAGLLDP